MLAESTSEILLVLCFVVDLDGEHTASYFHHRVTLFYAQFHHVFRDLFVSQGVFEFVSILASFSNSWLIITLLRVSKALLRFCLHMWRLSSFVEENTAGGGVLE